MDSWLAKSNIIVFLVMDIFIPFQVSEIAYTIEESFIIIKRFFFQYDYYME